MRCRPPSLGPRYRRCVLAAGAAVAFHVPSELVSMSPPAFAIVETDDDTGTGGACRRAQPREFATAPRGGGGGGSPRTAGQRIDHAVVQVRGAVLVVTAERQARLRAVAGARAKRGIAVGGVGLQRRLSRRPRTVGELFQHSLLTALGTRVDPGGDAGNRPSRTRRSSCSPPARPVVCCSGSRASDRSARSTSRWPVSRSPR